MRIEIQAIDRRASEIQETMAAIRAALEQVVDQIARVVVRLSAKTRRKQPLSRCVIEVHLTNGQVEIVEERQRRSGAAVRRALGRIWKAVAKR
ncbi:hypothetical protein HK414_14495 [Ramlibacter terrae]|uniref:HPF/RaiA family ribosome-associated protein n=1 Tax=Ramlibacter terrae TaxID=2732511 RepID=A0ABX6P364_9BURK|nr:hypothetical protein HK414_14495 [Ramlibacter terrae]